MKNPVQLQRHLVTAEGLLARPRSAISQHSQKSMQSITQMTQASQEMIQWKNQQHQGNAMAGILSGHEGGLPGGVGNSSGPVAQAGLMAAQNSLQGSKRLDGSQVVQTKLPPRQA